VAGTVFADHFIATISLAEWVTAGGKKIEAEKLVSVRFLSLPPLQGDQIGRNFAIWAIFYGIG
jgi:hypothetical protein